MKKVHKRLTYANLMATVAVFIALGGALRRHPAAEEQRTRSRGNSQSTYEGVR